MTTYKDEILAMDRFSIQGGKSVREYDQNGFLHVEYSPLTRVQVAPYRGFEIPGWTELGLDANKIYKGYRPAEELSKPDTIKSMNGIPIQFNHNPDYAHCPAKDTRVGSTGDLARFDEPFLFNSLHITDKKAIDHINDGTMRELSLAYRYTPEMKSGTAPNGEKYDFIMRGINANHLALVEEGRAGSEVLVYDSSQGNLMFEDEDKKNGLTDNEPPAEGGDEVEAILKKMVEAGLEPSQVVKFREELQKLKGGDDVIEDEEEPVAEEPVEPMDAEGEEKPEEPVEEAPAVEVEEEVEEENDDEPMEDAEDEDLEPVEEPVEDEETEEVEEAEEVEETDEVDEVEDKDEDEEVEEPMDDEDDEPMDEDVLEAPAMPEEGEGEEPAAPAQNSPERVVIDAMKACGLNPEDQAEQRAFAAGVKFGESELNAAKAQPQEPQNEQPQPPKAANPMMGKKPMGMDTAAIVKKVEARMNAKFRALKECEKTIGKVEPTAYDSAGSVYLDALRQEGIRVKGMDGKAARAAYRAYFAGKSKVERTLAQDSKPKAETVLSKTLNRIQYGE